MTDLTLAQRFGSNVTFNATSKILSIDLNDLTDSGDITGSLGIDISGMTDVNKNQYASKILYALLLLSNQKQPTLNNDETVAMFVNFERKRATTRNNVQQIEYRIVSLAYSADSIGDKPDPDSIG